MQKFETKERKIVMRKIKVYIILMIVIVTFMSIISTKSYAEEKPKADANGKNSKEL